MTNFDGKPIRVAAFTGGRNIGSRRFRVEQLISPLEAHGVEVIEYVAPLGSWPPHQRWLRLPWFFTSLLSRFPQIAASYKSQVTLFQREMISTMLTLEGITRSPRVLDVDDAVWLNPRADRNFPKLARICQGVICGNEFLAENIAGWNSNIVVVPTAVDTDRFRPLCDVPLPRPLIGWSGISSGFKYLYQIEPILVEVLRRRPDAMLRIFSNEKPRFATIDPARVDYIPFSPEAELAAIQEMSVGLMPIDDTLWSRGKCSYKMLLYMACGLPVVVSPYGMNIDVLKLADVGFGAKSDSEWVDAIVWLLDNPGKAKAMGINGRAVVEQHYSVRVLVPKLADFLRQFAG